MADRSFVLARAVGDLADAGRGRVDSRRDAATVARAATWRSSRASGECVHRGGADRVGVLVHAWVAAAATGEALVDIRTAMAGLDACVRSRRRPRHRNVMKRHRLGLRSATWRVVGVRHAGHPRGTATLGTTSRLDSGWSSCRLNLRHYGTSESRYPRDHSRCFVARLERGNGFDSDCGRRPRFLPHLRQRTYCSLGTYVWEREKPSEALRFQATTLFPIRRRVTRWA
jgi:hypothetical protein